jgi:competence protein ComEC
VGELFNHGAWLWMLLMVKISQWATTLPGAFRYVPAPNAFGFAAYYGLLVGALSGWLFKRENRRWAIGAVALALLYGGWEWHRARTQFDLTILPLNGGHAVHMDGPGRQHDWLVDCGNTNAVEFITKPFLRAQGLNALPRLALTHGDLQHVGGTKLMWSELPVEKTVTSPVRFRSATYRDIMGTLEATPHRHEIIQRSTTNGCWTVLHPDADDRFPQADDASLVLLGQIHNMRILLLGDLGRPGQEALMNRHTNLQADIVVTGLPEQGEALCDGLLERIQPKLVIIADSEFPATKRASPALHERLAKSGRPILYTRTASAVSIAIKPGNWQAQGMDGTVVRPAGNGAQP